MAQPRWVKEIIDAINSAVGNKSISKEALAEGLEEIEEQAGTWAQQMREELKDE